MKKTNGEKQVSELVLEFVEQIVLMVQTEMIQRVVEALAGSIVSSASVSHTPVARQEPKAKQSRKRPRKPHVKQLCPVPGCKGLAAPIFGMVCSEHKNVSKKLIRKYREERKAVKLGKKPASKKPAPKKPAPKKPALKKSAPKKPAPKKPAPKKPAPKKTAPKKVAPKKVVLKWVKAAPKKVAPKKAMPKKVAPKKTEKMADSKYTETETTKSMLAT